MHFALRLLPTGLLALMLLTAAPAPAATITVDTLEDRLDRKVCSLRAAVEAAHRDSPVARCRAGAPGLDTIRFHSDLKGAIRLQSPLYIESDLSIEGTGPDRLAISDALVLIDTAGRARVDLAELEMRTGLSVRGVAALNIRSLRFKSIRGQMSRASAIQVDGSRSGPVGSVSIRNSSFESNEGNDSPLSVVGETLRLTLHEVEFLGNHGDWAGAILLDGAGPVEVDITDSTFGGNRSDSGLAGAIVSLDEAQIELSRATFMYNQGWESGAMFIAADRLRIENSAFYQNGSPNTGAIHIVELGGASGDSQLLFSTLVDNDSGGSGPALVNQSRSPLWLGGNLLRPGNATASCDPQGLASIGYNLELDAASCRLYGPGDMDYVQMMLYRINGGSAAASVPVPDPYHWAGVDAVPDYACNDLDGNPIGDDFLARVRPVDFASGQPGFYCDVGAVELRASDPLTPLP